MLWRVGPIWKRFLSFSYRSIWKLKLCIRFQKCFNRGLKTFSRLFCFLATLSVANVCPTVEECLELHCLRSFEICGIFKWSFSIMGISNNRCTRFGSMYSVEFLPFRKSWTGTRWSMVRVVPNQSILTKLWGAVSRVLFDRADPANKASRTQLDMVNGSSAKNYWLLIGKHANIYLGVWCSNDLQIVKLISSPSFSIEFLQVTCIWRVGQELIVRIWFVKFFIWF